MTMNFAIYSAGGFAREIKTAFSLSQGQSAQDGFQLYFIDDDPNQIGTVVNGTPIISFEEAKSIRDLKFNIALASCELRKKKYRLCLEADMVPFSIFSPSFVSYDDTSVGAASVLADFAMLTANVHTGTSFHCNIYSYVAHDCIVGDFVTLAPRVSVNGRVKIEDDVYIGTGAIILPGKPDKFITIGSGAIVGAGAVVTKDVEPYSTVVGAPAKPLQKRSHDGHTISGNSAMKSSTVGASRFPPVTLSSST